MKSVYFKNFIVAAGLLLASFVILGVALVFIGRSYVISEKRESLELNAREVVKYAMAFSGGDDLSAWSLRAALTSVSRSTGHHIFVCDGDGVIVSCSDMELVCPHLGKVVGETVLDAVDASGGYDQLSTLNGLYDGTRYVVAQPMLVDGETVGYVFVSAGSDFIGAAWGTFLFVFLGMALIIMATAVTLSYVTSKRQARPINEMAGAARKFAHGDFSVRVKDGGRTDEFGELIEAFNQMADSVEKTEKLRREFIANVSHELRTPMTTISGFADGILDGTIPPESQTKYLQVISDETKRLSRLIKRMLELSRLQQADTAALRARSFNISELAARVLVSCEERINARGLTVDLRLPEEDVLVVGDPDGITQVVYNLIDNAVKFAEPGSELSLMLWKQNGKAMVSVRNRGETIPADDLPYIFDRFHKSDRSRSRDREGMGLGLYIVKTILDNHDEDIFVTSRDGITEFVFSLTLKSEK